MDTEKIPEHARAEMLLSVWNTDETALKWNLILLKYMDMKTFQILVLRAVWATDRIPKDFNQIVLILTVLIIKCINKGILDSKLN